MDPNSYPYLDYFQLHYGRELHYGQNYEFVAPISNQDIRFLFYGQRPSDIRLWDITFALIYGSDKSVSSILLEHSFMSLADLLTPQTATELV